MRKTHRTRLTLSASQANLSQLLFRESLQSSQHAYFMRNLVAEFIQTISENHYIIIQSLYQYHTVYHTYSCAVLFIFQVALARAFIKILLINWIEVLC